MNLSEKNGRESAISYRFMILTFKIRDFFSPRDRVLKEVRLEKGDKVLDYGCGPGAYVLDAAKLVGDAGKVYALDIHPIAVQAVRGLVAKKAISNVETVLVDGRDIGLTDRSVDVILFYDVLHCIEDRDGVLKELYRVLKPDGRLSFSDHHMKRQKIIAQVTAENRFKLVEEGKKTFTFSRL